MVTIVMAVYNGEKYIKEQLDSLENQTKTDWQLCVQDDASTDGSCKIIEEFAKTSSHKVTLWKRISPSGSAKNNFAELLQKVAAMKCEYVMCCDQDDIWMEDKIETTWKRMERVEKTAGRDVPILVHTDLEVVDEKGDMLAPSFFSMSHIAPEAHLAQLLIQNNVTGCSMMMNYPLLSAIADSVVDDAVIMHDYWAALYARVFGKISVITKPTICYRQHAENSVGAKDSENPVYLSNRLKAGKKDYEQAMENSQKQIAYFLECFGEKMIFEDKDRKYEMLLEYANLADLNWRERKHFYRTNRVWKKGAARKIMQCIWG